MIDPIVSLAFSLHSQKGVFALLVGSGISRAAGIPTGWEVVQDLCRKLAIVEGENCEPDPAVWYKDKYEKDADYADLLGALGRTPSERQRLLRGYFEPTEEEQAEGKKTPTAAHKSIASLVALGAFRVIITTNFDRLLEAALQEEGIQPTIISTPDAAKGAVPLVHSPCTILKVHGDYLDTRIKNATDELAEYAPEINTLLDRILDEYGLLICGWSGDWDIALRAAIERTTNRRFSTYWAARGNISKTAKKIITHRQALIISGKDADIFFTDLKEKTLALERIDRQHPLSKQIAVAQLKRSIENEKTITAHDLILNETERVITCLGKDNFPFSGISVDGIVLLDRLQLYESHIDTLLQLFAIGCYWERESTSYIWPKFLLRLANARDREEGSRSLIDLRRYPAMLCFYAAGIACIANGCWKTLAKLLSIQMKSLSSYGSVVISLNESDILAPDMQKRLPGREREYTPISNHIFDYLRPIFSEIIADDIHFSLLFNNLEALISLVYTDNKFDNEDLYWAPTGRFIWDRSIYPERFRADDILIQEFNKDESNWPPYAFGLLKDGLQRTRDVIAKWKDLLSDIRRHHRIR